MEVFLIKALQLILALSLLVLLHEGGHFLFAKLFKVRVEKFCLFFDPWFTLFKFKPKHSATTYGVGWLPLGGYVKISGMIDESMDTEQMKQPAQPWEFRSKPAWQRLLIMIGGVLVNFLLALFLYSMVLYVWGDRYLPVQNMTMGMQFNQHAEQLGFRDGDVLLHTDTKTFQRFNGDLFRDITEAKTVTVRRQGKDVTLSMPAEGLSLLTILKEEPMFMQPYLPSVIDSVQPASPAFRAGIRAGDKLVSFNGAAIQTWGDVNDQLGRVQDVCNANRTHADSLKARMVTVAYARGQVIDTTKLQLNPDLQMGVVYGSLQKYYTPVTLHYGIFSCVPAGIRHGWNVLAGYVNDMKYVFTSEGAKSMGGFGAIGSIFPSQWDWQRFWELTAFLSIILAFMNILPIPALDGGHVLFLLYEIIVRRKPSDKFLERAQVVGMSLLILLMLWANFNDIFKFFFK
jgi:regulator of sigma E protease